MTEPPAPITSAGIYDCWLGGQECSDTERAAAGRIVQAEPSVPRQARINRAFLGRAVRAMAQAGVTQFLDIGSGWPTQGNVHEVARQVAPTARVAYVDFDAAVVERSRRILAGEWGVTFTQGDVRQMRRLLEDPALQALDWDRPVGVLMVAVLHFLYEGADQIGREVADELLERVAPGSLLAISHAMVSPEKQEELNATLRQTPNNAMTKGGNFRSEQEIARMFGRWELVEPGLVQAERWRGIGIPDVREDYEEGAVRGPLWSMAGVATTPTK